VTDQTVDLAAQLETIRRQMAAVAADRPTPEQVAEWNAADKAMAQRIHAALPGVPLHHAYAVLQALRTVQQLDAVAEDPSGRAPAADRAALHDRIAALFRHPPGVERLGDATPGEIADAVLAVLPATDNQAAEIERLRERHKASLRRADQINNELMEEVQRYAAGTERPVLWSVYNQMHLRALEAENQVARLRRMAGEDRP
jgi:hypothetical protein